MGSAPLTQPSSAEFRVTAPLQEEAWRTRTLPPVESLPGGVWSIPVPMTDQPMRYTLCYVIESDRGAVVVDPGWPDDIAWDALVTGLALAGVRPEDVHGVLVSHAHSDHHGLSGRLREASGCWIGMHPADIEILQRLADGSGLAARGTPFLVLVGAPGSEQSEMSDVRPVLRRLAGTIPDRIVEHGDKNLVPGRRVGAVWTPGHTPGHLCFVDEDSDYLFTGDHMLPRITPHVGGYLAGATDHLGQYLKSLEDLLPYDGAEVLPAHEYRFRGVGARVRVMQDHHRVRLDEVVEVVHALGEASVWDVASRLDWSRGWDETTDMRRRLALTETLAHLRHLTAVGRLLDNSDKTPRWRGIGPTSQH